MIEDIKKDAEHRMKKSVEALEGELVKIRTGRAHTSLLDHVTVSYYGNETPLNQVANVTVGDSRTINISPWEKNMVQPIEKAIMNAGLGLNPATTGTLIRIPLPPLTEERRKELVKVVRSEGENAKIAIRNIRRDVLGDAKQLLKDKLIGEDDERKAQDLIQKITDKYIASVDSRLEIKEKELMEI